ncbi:nitrate assimilation regulatory nirA [Fusarium beomiforme]|uniref:Nitrate assimilation regulatory nirA n=1 Tax=Fusarium beomiforme TaxID=44412 RepID=A0A9P5AKU1_9HYPO|nr:nitrate assimilation regulatory nirA [Fusarium beomiforme]
MAEIRLPLRLSRFPKGRKYQLLCDGIRPICLPCTNRGQECHYSIEESDARPSFLKRKYDDIAKEFQALQRSHENLEQLFHALQSRSESDVTAIVHQIRRGADASSILRHIQAGDLLVQLHTRPETRFRHEFPYRAGMPVFLQTQQNPYLQSLMYEAAFMRPPAEQSASELALCDRFRPQYLKPYLAAEIVDPRLDVIKPSAWTNVSTDDDMMRKLLRLYFLHEYHWLSCFHKDYFLDDMLAGSKKYCSSLLVNAVLAQACNCNPDLSDRLEYWNPHSLGYKFFAEAKRLWEMELMEKSSITTVQAAVIINIIYNMYSMDKLGMTYGVQAVAMAKDLKIFYSSSRPKSMKRQHVYDFTAWCLYYWMSLQCYHFMVPSFIKDPPKVALPNPDSASRWAGEFLLRYPLSQTLYSMHHAELFKSKMDLIRVINRIGVKLFHSTDSASGEEDNTELNEYLIALKNWYLTLPASLAPSAIIFPCQLKLHLLYHNVVINLCELLVPSGKESEADQTSEETLAQLSHSRICFETIMRLYYLRHGFESADAYMAHDLAVLGFMALGKLKDGGRVQNEDLRSTLLLAAKGLGDQGRNYYFPFTLFHVIQGEMSEEDKALLHQFMTSLKEDVISRQVRAKHVQAQYPCDIIKITDYPESKRLGNLIKQYVNLAISEAQSPMTSEATNSP